MLSKQLYKSFNISTTCIGVLSEHNAVKPTISEKKMVTPSNCSANTGCPSFNLLATDLKTKKNIGENHFVVFLLSFKKMIFGQDADD